MAARTTENNGNDDGEEKIFTVGVPLESYEVDGDRRRQEDALIEAVLGSVKKRKQGKKTAMWWRRPSAGNASERT